MNFLEEFIKKESSAGIVLIFVTILALLLQNSPLSALYHLFLHTPVEIRFGALHIDKPLYLWINDGLMAIFFLLIGLEVKREFIEGHLSDMSQVALPAIAAVGGMVVPALFYVYFNQDQPLAMQGWAIPTATDIAFALGILSLLGNRVPASLKIFLLALAIIDDLGAIIIIALFYTSDLSVASLVTAAVCLPVLALLNWRGVKEKAPYLFIGLVLWVAVLKSGVHATLAGVALAAFIPMRNRDEESSPLHDIEHDLHTAVAYAILPIFAFANAGIALKGLTFDSFLHPVPLGIVAGLFVGKQLGVFLFCALGVALGIARLPEGLRWSHIYGTALICGVGFTMSLFIGSLAFEETGVNLLFDERLGIITGSLLSGLVGYLVLHLTLPEPSIGRPDATRAE